jgi:TfoX/Sxy family transcriptional regulator of competence genes
MAYNEKSANRLRSIFSGKKVKEIKMMGGIAFMLNGKMCAGVIKDEMFFRINPDIYDEALQKTGSRPMEITGRRLSAGWVMVSEAGIKTKTNFDYWITLALDFNKKAKAAKKKSPE